MAKICLPYGDEFLELQVPDRYIGTIVTPKRMLSASSPEDLILEAIHNPVGSPVLSRIVRPGQKVVLIVDDVSRETPANLILPHVLDQLLIAGTKPEDIRIVIALGTHRPMTQAEIIKKIGSDAAQCHQVVNTPCSNESETRYVGTSSSGIPAFLNRTVADADVRIGIGMITPHMDAGFSGGAKIILPGVCGTSTVEAFHSRQAEIQGNQLGLENAPLRLALEAFVEERVGLDFIFNVVIDSEGSVYSCVAGHFIEAHRAGVAIAREVYGTSVPKPYPLVISNAFPAQMDLWQSSKGIASGELMVRDGGTLILVTHCTEGNKTHPLYPEYIGSNLDYLLATLKAGKAEDPVACALAAPICRVKQRIKVAVVSCGLEDRIAAQMGITYYDNIESALSKELALCPQKDGCLGFLTHGGASLPIIEEASAN
jgi:nickel-dependent lactate racemase